MAKWVFAAEMADLPAEDVASATIGDRQLALYRVDRAVFATDGTCTHGNARLCDGFLDGFEIECPLHQGKFDIRTGKAVCAPVVIDIRTYPIRIEGSKVFVQVD